MTIHKAGGTEIGRCLNPETEYLGRHIANGGSHGVHAYISPDTEGTGEEPRHTLPNARNGRLRPRHTRNKEQQQRYEHHQQHDILAITHEARHGYAEEYASQHIRHHHGEQTLPSGELQETEDARHHHSEVSTHHGIDHEVSEALASHHAPHPIVTGMDGHQVAIAVLLARRTSSQANAQHQCLLQNQYQHGRKHRRAIATLRIEHGDLIELERTSRNHFLANGVTARYLLLNIGTHLLRHSNSRLINSLIREHEGHVAIHAHHTLFHAIEARAEVGRDVVDTLDQLTTDERLGIIEIVSPIGHMHIGRGIAHTDELARLLRVGQVDHSHRHIVHRFVIIDP